jgi:hypothetical protein
MVDCCATFGFYFTYFSSVEVSLLRAWSAGVELELLAWLFEEVVVVFELTVHGIPIFYIFALAIAIPKFFIDSSTLSPVLALTSSEV